MAVKACGLLAAIEAAVAKPGGTCGYRTVHALLDAADAKALTEAMATPNYTSAAIARALTDRGHRISQGTVQRHRRGECRCGTR